MRGERMYAFTNLGKMKGRGDHERRPNRLKGYDYSRDGFYFVTICTKNGIPWFGKIKNDKMILNTFGKHALKSWTQIPRHFPNARLDEFIIMPNHIHGIIEIHNKHVGNAYMRSLRNEMPHWQRRTKMYLPKIIHEFKAAVKRASWQEFYIQNFAWQKSYYDHIIRDEKGLNTIREYIRSNPVNWKNDRNNSINP